MQKLSFEHSLKTTTEFRKETQKAGREHTMQFKLHCVTLWFYSLLFVAWISSREKLNTSIKNHSASKAEKLNNSDPPLNTLTAQHKETCYLWLSLRASFPFRHEIMPRGDILGLHSIRTSPPCRAKVWAFNKFWEKSGAIAGGQKRKEKWKGMWILWGRQERRKKKEREKKRPMSKVEELECLSFLKHAGH